jgi:hypothetical protein
MESLSGVRVLCGAAAACLCLALPLLIHDARAAPLRAPAIAQAAAAAERSPAVVFGDNRSR